MRDLESNSDPRAALAVDHFVYRVGLNAGMLAAALGGLDAFVFTAGIGENSATIRARIAEKLTWLGVDVRCGSQHGRNLLISRPESRVALYVVPTDEELMIARHTLSLLPNSSTMARSAGKLAGVTVNIRATTAKTSNPGRSAMEGTALSKDRKEQPCWRGFKPGSWCNAIDVRDFIVSNVTPYPGDEKFLAGPSKRTKAVWDKLQPYFQEERKKGVLAVDAKTPSTLLAHKAGYIDRDNEVIVGLQTDQPFKRAIFPYGGLRMVEAGLEGGRLRGRPAGPRGLHEVSQDPQRRRVRRLHARNHEVPEVRHHHRPS